VKIENPHLKIAFVSLPRGRAVSLAMGWEHTVVLFKSLPGHEGGSYYASFGGGNHGKLGLGDSDDRYSPVAGFGIVDPMEYLEMFSSPVTSRTVLSGLIISVLCGVSHTVCLTVGGRAYAFGCNEKGLCGFRVGSVSSKNGTGQCGVNFHEIDFFMPTLVVHPTPDLKFVKICSGYEQNFGLVVGPDGGLNVVSWGFVWVPLWVFHFI